MHLDFSLIGWTNFTLNFWWGCKKVSPACQHCYAQTIAKVFGKRLFGQVPEWGQGKPRFERLAAARKEALALNKAAQQCRLIEGVPMRIQIDTQTIGDPSARTLHVGDVRTPVKKRQLIEITPAVWDAAPPWRPRVFVNSMSDWLDEEVPIAWLAYLLETLHLCPHLDFQLLTKRPENWRARIHAAYVHVAAEAKNPNLIADLYNWQKTEQRANNQFMHNLWLGTTVESQEWADKRLPHLLAIPAHIRFLSCEPLLGPIDLTELENWKGGGYAFNALTGHADGIARGMHKPIHWVITGGESGGNARPTHPDWIRSLRDQCAAAGVPFFFKQWGEYIPAGSEAQHLDAKKTYKHLWMPSTAIPDPSTGSEVATQTLMLRAGTDHTGRHLDGILHDSFPQVAQASPPDRVPGASRPVIPSKV